MNNSDWQELGPPYRTADVARMLGCSEGTVLRWVNNGTVPPPDILGCPNRWFRPTILKWMQPKKDPIAQIDKPKLPDDPFAVAIDFGNGRKCGTSA